MSQFRNKILRFTAFAIPVILYGCSLEEEEDSSGTGYYQFVNLSPQSPAIEFVVDDSTIDELDYAEATDYENVSTGSYDIEFNQILPNSEEDNFIDDETLHVDKKKLHSFILYGDASSPSTFEIEMDISDVYDDDFEDGFGMIQFVNLANTAETVDMYLIEADENLLNKNVGYTLAQADSSGDAEVTEGDYKIVFTESGTDTILAQKNDIEIDEGDAKSFILVSYDVAGSSDVRYKIIELSDSGARALTNEAEDAHIRVANGISNTSGISVATGDSTNVIETYIGLGALSYDIEVTPSVSDEAESTTVYVLNSEDGAELEETTFNVYADDQILLLSAGDATTTVSLNETDEDLRIIETHGKLLFSHVIYSESDESLEIVIVEQGGDPDSYDAELSVSYLESESYEIEAGSYDIYIYDSSDELLLDYTIYDLQEGGVVNLITTDFDYGGSPYQITEYVN
ncbi:MAG: DUF4397 domain-containing protein [Paraglaciecola sp.]|uniref:DUF4397 domain-containing protein n=1 Tax=Paraglaciecola sp. TaxID=1920173 RepID=UPI003296B982